MNRFAAWWLDSLAQLLPERFLAGETVELPAHRFLLRSVRLPAAIRENPDAALAAELDRVTPFAADEAWFLYRLGAEEGGEVTVDLAVLPRRTPIDGAVTRAVMAQAPDWLRGRNFLPRRPTLRFALSQPVLLALILALLLPSVVQSWQRGHLEDQLADAKHQAAETLQLSRDYASRRAGLSPLEVERAQRPTMTRLLADLTKALPSAAYLDSLSADGSSVTLTGYAASAADLIPALSQSGAFTEVHFTGAVTREADRGLERFQISALYAAAAP